LETVVEEQRVTSKFFDGITAGLHAVFVDQNDDVAQVGRKHVGLVAGRFGIEEEGATIGNHAGRSGLFPEQEFVEEALGERGRFGAITAGKDGDGAALVFQFASEFFDDRGFSGAADGEIANGDDLNAEGRISQDASVIEKLASLYGDEECPGKAEENAAGDGGSLALALLEDDLEDKGLKFFDP
jgi:hypothetical protein